jgi:hypothetical protein
MSQVEAKPRGNWCLAAKPDEQGRCGADKITFDGKRHHCDKPSEHADDVHACGCGQQWRHFM